MEVCALVVRLRPHVLYGVFGRVCLTSTCAADPAVARVQHVHNIPPSHSTCMRSIGGRFVWILKQGFVWCIKKDSVVLHAGFYEDFARVADDEARHFGWCVQRMAELGHR